MKALPERVTVLVTSAGSAPAVAVIQALREQQEIPVRLVAADMDPLSVGFHLSDESVVVPGAVDHGFAEQMIRVCQARNVDVVFPIIDEELQLFAEAAPQFYLNGIDVVTNGPETVRTARDKWLTYHWCRQHGVRTPQTWLSESGPTVRQFPLIVKPRSGRGSVGVSVARTDAELDASRGDRRDVLIQEFVEGPEFTVDLLADREGRVVSAVPRERLVTKAGMCVKGRTVREPRLIELAVAVAESFGLTPRGNLQFCRSLRDGEYYLIEVNPKFGSGLPLTTAAGINMPLLLLKMLRGERVSPMIGQFRSGLVMLRHWTEIFVPDEADPPSFIGHGAPALVESRR